MATICPTITAENTHVYREQIERVESFAERIHIDLMDGVFTPNKSIAPEQVWWPTSISASVHLMYKDPTSAIDVLLKQKPETIFVSATEQGGENRIIAARCREAGVQFGVVLYPDDDPAVIREYADELDAVLIFSGNLGYQGGSRADISLLSRVDEIYKYKPGVRIEWDGGVNDKNISDIVHAGVDVCNVGGYIHSAVDPVAAYNTLCAILKQ